MYTCLLRATDLSYELQRSKEALPRVPAAVTELLGRLPPFPSVSDN
jgi:hypothetical protein